MAIQARSQEVKPRGAVMLLQTSVSQRPLTAQKRLRSTSATAGTSLTHQQASSMPTQRRHTAAQPGVPVFRSGSDNRQLLQQQPATDTLQTGRLRQPQDNGQEYVQRCKVSGSSLGVAQEPQAVVAHQQPLISVQQPRVQQVAAAQRGLPQSLHSREAELRFGNAAQQLQMPQQAYGSQSILSPSLSSAAMCVKPPWAIDDPFQVRQHLTVSPVLRLTGSCLHAICSLLNRHCISTYAVKQAASGRRVLTTGA